jgi:hypothetical protein
LVCGLFVQDVFCIAICNNYGDNSAARDEIGEGISTYFGERTDSSIDNIPDSQGVLLLPVWVDMVFGFGKSTVDTVFINFAQFIVIEFHLDLIYLL